MHKNMQNKAKYAVKYAQSLHFNAYLFNQSPVPPRQTGFRHWSLASTSESLLGAMGLDKDLLDFSIDVVNVGELIPDILGYP